MKSGKLGKIRPQWKTPPEPRLHMQHERGNALAKPRLPHPHCPLLPLLRQPIQSQHYHDNKVYEQLTSQVMQNESSNDLIRRAPRRFLSAARTALLEALQPLAQSRSIAIKELSYPWEPGFSARRICSRARAVGRVRSRANPKNAFLNLRCNQQRHCFAAFMIDRFSAGASFGSRANSNLAVKTDQLARAMVLWIAN